jgi:hypothetical protein
MFVLTTLVIFILSDGDAYQINPSSVCQMLEYKENQNVLEQNLFHLSLFIR